MSDIFREVDEEVRRDQLLALWKQFRVPLIVIVVVIVGGVSGWKFWQEQQRQEREAESAEFNQAVELLTTGDITAGRAELEDLEDSAGPGYRFVARLQHAASLTEAGDAEAALSIYDAIAADDGLEPRQRELGDLLAAYLLVDLENSDAVRARLQPLAVDEGAWRFSAWDLLALLDFNDGDTVAAAETYRRLVADSGTPQALRQRATDMLDLMEAMGLDSGTAATPLPEEGEAAQTPSESDDDASDTDEVENDEDES